MNGKSCFADDISFHQAATFEFIMYVIHTIFSQNQNAYIFFVPQVMSTQGQSIKNVDMTDTVD